VVKIKTRARGEEGAAAVEFALIVGVLAMLIFGMLQFGVAFFQLQNLRAASREGARVGALNGTVQQVKDQVQQASGVTTDISAAMYVKTRTNGTLAGSISDPSNKPCDPTNPSMPDSVVAGIDLNSLPQSLRDIFTIDIPLLPTIPITSATVQGEFRCEG